MIKFGRGRAKRLVLDIGSSAIRLCELSQTKAGYQLTKYYQREILNDPAVDEETKKKARKDALKALLKEAKVRTRKTIIAVPGRSVFTRTRTLPPVPEYKVSQIVKYEIQQQIPFALDQIALGYQILNRSESGSYDVMMAAIKVDVVEKHTEILNESKRVAHTVDVSPIAAYNWVKHCGEFGTEGDCVALLDMGAATTDIIIERGNQFRFTRPLNIGGDDITSAIASTFNVNFTDAEKAKRQRAFAPTGDPRQDGKLGETVGAVLNRLVNEINRSFGYFRSLPGGGAVDRVIITGGGACLRNIIPFLKRQLGVDVRIARPLAGLAVGAAAQEANEHPEQACVALGMALRTCEKVAIEINLVPPRVLEAARRKEQVVYWVLSFIVFGFIAASIIPAREEKDKQVQQEIQRLEQILQKYDPVLVKYPERPSEFVTDLNAKMAEIGVRLKNLENLRRANMDSRFWLRMLQVLNEARPEGAKVWFSSIQTSIITPGGESSPAGGRGGALRNPTVRGSASGVNSTGFTSVSPGGGAGGGGAGFGRGARIGGGGGGGAPAASGRGNAAQPGNINPPSPNGLKILAFAKDPESITQFVAKLRELPNFKAGVHFNESTIEKVSITEMDNAPCGDMGGPIARGGGGGFNPAFGGRRTGNVAAPVYGEAVLSFRVDVQFAAAPVAAAPPKPPPIAMPSMSTAGGPAAGLAVPKAFGKATAKTGGAE